MHQPSRCLLIVTMSLYSLTILYMLEEIVSLKSLSVSGAFAIF